MQGKKMNSQNVHIDLLNTHLVEHGISGLLPHNLSETLLKIMSEQFDDFQLYNYEGSDNVAVLLTSVLYLLMGDVNPIDKNKTLVLNTKDFTDKLNSYGLSITIEEIRRSGLIEILEENLPTIGNILDDNRELIATGDYDAIQDFLEKFKN